MSTLFTASTALPLTLNLDDGSTTYYPRAYIFTNGALVDTVDLGHIGLGRYSGTWIPGTSALYDALFITYEDAARTTESSYYTREMEKWQNDDIIATGMDRASLPADTADAVWDELLASHTINGSAGEYLARLTQTHVDNVADSNVRVKLIEKIQRNRLELADGSTDNWILYDDDNTTPLLEWSVSDKDGDGIAQQKFVPSHRTRGVAP